MELLSVACIRHSFIDYPSLEDDAICVYFNGCSHGCVGCHSTSLQEEILPNFKLDDIKLRIIIEARESHTNKVVLTGGDPLQQEIPYILDLLSWLDDMEMDVMIYTGYPIHLARNILKNGIFTYLKCGQYSDSMRQVSGKFEDRLVLASTNQEIYDFNYNLLTKNGIMYF